MVLQGFGHSLQSATMTQLSAGSFVTRRTSPNCNDIQLVYRRPSGCWYARNSRSRAAQAAAGT